jgi:hypothetical protein
MGKWWEDAPCPSKKKESDDEAGLGIESGYLSNRAHSRHSLSWQSGRCRDKTLGYGDKDSYIESEEYSEHGDDSDMGNNNRKTPPLFQVAKVGVP